MKLPGLSADQSEVAVLSACLRDPTTVDEAVALGLGSEDFLDRRRRELWSGMVQDRARGMGPDEATLLERHEHRVGPGKPFVDFTELSNVIRSITTTRGQRRYLARYLSALADAKVRRRLVVTAEGVLDLAREGSPTGEMLDHAEQGILGASKTRGGVEHRRMADVFSDAADRIDAIRSGEQVDTRILTGLSRLDRYLVLRPGHFGVWAGRPSMGKTQTVLSVLRHIAENSGPVLLVSREMGRDALGDRLVSTEEASGCSRKESRARWGSMPFLVDDRSRSLGEAVSSIRLAHHKHGIVAVAVDYLQLLSLPAGDSREVQVANASAAFRDLTQDTGVVMFLLSQLNRGVEARKDRRPALSDLRESGAIEQDADSVVMLYRHAYYAKAAKNPHELELIIRKQRNGRSGVTAFQHFEPGQWVVDPSGAGS